MCIVLNDLALVVQIELLGPLQRTRLPVLAGHGTAQSHVQRTAGIGRFHEQGNVGLHLLQRGVFRVHGVQLFQGGCLAGLQVDGLGAPEAEADHNAGLCQFIGREMGQLCRQLPAGHIVKGEAVIDLFAVLHRTYNAAAPDPVHLDHCAVHPDERFGRRLGLHGRLHRCRLHRRRNGLLLFRCPRKDPLPGKPGLQHLHAALRIRVLVQRDVLLCRQMAEQRIAIAAGTVDHGLVQPIQAICVVQPEAAIVDDRIQRIDLRTERVALQRTHCLLHGLLIVFFLIIKDRSFRGVIAQCHQLTASGQFGPHAHCAAEVVQFRVEGTPRLLDGLPQLCRSHPRLGRIAVLNVVGKAAVAGLCQVFLICRQVIEQILQL